MLAHSKLLGASIHRRDKDQDPADPDKQHTGASATLDHHQASNVQDEPTPCLFTGNLDDDPDSRVTVSGCEGDEETVVTIGSVKVGRAILNQCLNLESGGRRSSGPSLHKHSDLPDGTCSFQGLSFKG